MSRAKGQKNGGLSQRLTVRFTFEQWRQLRELQFALRAPTPGQTLRMLVGLHHAAERAAIARLRQSSRWREQFETLIQGDKP
jgi:hypothetical protein